MAEKCEAQLEAIVNREYDGMEIPEIRALVEKASKVLDPCIEEFNRLAAKHFPAEFSRPTMSLNLRAGGFSASVRDKIRRDAATHLNATYAFMLANSANYTTGIVSDATMHATDNPEVAEVLKQLAAPNRATPTLEPPGPAIGILRKLLPNPEEWGLAGYDSRSPLLPASETQKALAPPDDEDE